LRRAILVIVLLAAGCGGGGGGGGSGESTSWSEKAEAICARLEAGIRDRPPAKSSADLERAMAAVVDDMRAAREDLKALELPAAERAKAKPFLASVDAAVGMARVLRDGARDPDKIGPLAADARLAAADVRQKAAAAGLRRCARDAESAGVDAVLMPSFAEFTAAVVVDVVKIVERAERSGTPGRGATYWRMVEPVTTYLGASAVPESVNDEEVAFVKPIRELEYDVPRLRAHYEGGHRLGDRELRRLESHGRRVLLGARRKGFDLVEATGAPGERLIPRMRRALGS
jgi:hypothetical protein